MKLFCCFVSVLGLMLASQAAQAGVVEVAINSTAFTQVAVGNGSAGTNVVSNQSAIFCLTWAASLPLANAPCIIAGGVSATDAGVTGITTTQNIYVISKSQSTSVVKVITP
jgi:hypothetical protein